MTEHLWIFRPASTSSSLLGSLSLSDGERRKQFLLPENDASLRWLFHFFSDRLQQRDEQWRRSRSIAGFWIHTLLLVYHPRATWKPSQSSKKYDYYHSLLFTLEGENKERKEWEKNMFSKPYVCGIEKEPGAAASAAGEQDDKIRKERKNEEENRF